jgi:DNA-nicking Smr family endonuclease
LVAWFRLQRARKETEEQAWKSAEAAIRTQNEAEDVIRKQNEKQKEAEEANTSAEKEPHAEGDAGKNRRSQVLVASPGATLNPKP